MRFKALALAVLTAQPLTAHEFWIAQQSDLAVAEPFHPQVMIGENLTGDIFPFQPQAYAEAFWITPQKVQVLHTRRISEGPPRLSASANGLHVLAVSTYPQTFVHPSRTAFAAYAKTDAMLLIKEDDLPGDTVRETYRRYSKTLIQFGSTEKKDRRTGLDYEWVQDAVGFMLFGPEGPMDGRKAKLTCRTEGNSNVTPLITDDAGQVQPVLASDSECLLNAVLLSDRNGAWHSDWVSLHFRTGTID